MAALPAAALADVWCAPQVGRVEGGYDVNEGGAGTPSLTADALNLVAADITSGGTVSFSLKVASLF